MMMLQDRRSRDAEGVRTGVAGLDAGLGSIASTSIRDLFAPEQRRRRRSSIVLAGTEVPADMLSRVHDSSAPTRGRGSVGDGRAVSTPLRLDLERGGRVGSGGGGSGASAVGVRGGPDAGGGLGGGLGRGRLGAAGVPVDSDALGDELFAAHLGSFALPSRSMTCVDYLWFSVGWVRPIAVLSIPLADPAGGAPTDGVRAEDGVDGGLGFEDDAFGLGVGGEGDDAGWDDLSAAPTLEELPTRPNVLWASHHHALVADFIVIRDRVPLEKLEG